MVEKVIYTIDDSHKRRYKIIINNNNIKFYERELNTNKYIKVDYETNHYIKIYYAYPTGKISYKKKWLYL